MVLCGITRERAGSPPPSRFNEKSGRKSARCPGIPSSWNPVASHEEITVQYLPGLVRYIPYIRIILYVPLRYKRYERPDTWQLVRLQAAGDLSVILFPAGADDSFYGFNAKLFPF